MVLQVMNAHNVMALNLQNTIYISQTTHAVINAQQGT